jgi:hypothetical protein
MKKTPEDLVNEIQEACSRLGWCIAMDDSEDTIVGLVVGKLQYVEEVLSQIEESDKYTVYAAGQTADPDMH